MLNFTAVLSLCSVSKGLIKGILQLKLQPCYFCTLDRGRTKRNHNLTIVHHAAFVKCDSFEPQIVVPNKKKENKFEPYFVQMKGKSSLKR